MRFDPMTGQPINNTNTTVVPNMPNNTTVQNQNFQINQDTQTIQNQPIQQQPINQQSFESTMINQINQMQSIPTVDQSKQDFINNTQNINAEKKEEKKQGINYVFIIILFIIIFAAIFFLFPILLKYI